MVEYIGCHPTDEGKKIKMGQLYLRPKSVWDWSFKDWINTLGLSSYVSPKIICTKKEAEKIFGKIDFSKKHYITSIEGIRIPIEIN
jgi:hypothetical protein